MKSSDLKPVFESIYQEIYSNKDELVRLDAMFGDGDLGLSMVDGFSGINDYLKTCEEIDLGKTFMGISKSLNESAPSSLGTIISFLFLGMAKDLKGKENASLSDVFNAFRSGVDLICKRANSNCGEKTILDTFIPLIKYFNDKDIDSININDFFYEAETVAYDSCLKTKEMMAKHGRAAYHKENTIGVIDGGAMVGYLIFKGINNSILC